MKALLRSSLEILEDRIAPAGVVTAVYDPATFTLTLSGDGDANAVEVFQTGPNTHRVEGIATEINPGFTFMDIGKLTRLVYTGGAGDDDLALTNLRTLTSLSISGGAGFDETNVFNLAVTGTVTIQGDTDTDTFTALGISTFIGGDVIAGTGAAATDVLGVVFDAQRTVIGGRVVFTGGGGPDELGFFGEGPATIAKGVSFTAGAGGGGVSLANDDLLTIGKLPSGESILFTGGDGEDSLAINSFAATIAGGVRMTGGNAVDGLSVATPTSFIKMGKLTTGESILFDAGADNDSLTLTASNLSLAGGVRFDAGDGDNELRAESPGGIAKIGKLNSGASINYLGGANNDTIATNHAALTLAGGIVFGGGNGTNLIELNAPNGVIRLGKLTTGQSILFAGGTGNDDIFTDIAVALLSGGIELDGGSGGDNDVAFDNDGGVVRIGKLGTGQSVKLDGTLAADNEIDIGGFATLAGSIEVTGGSGGEDIDLDGRVSVGKNAAGASIVLVGNDGNDEIDFSDNITLVGGVTLDGGNNNDRIDWNLIDSLRVGGPVELLGGLGNDVFDARVYSLTLGGSVTFTGGGDTDSFSLVGDGTVAGDVTVDLGTNPAGSQPVTLRSESKLGAGLRLRGALTVDADAANTTTDSLILTNVSVGRLIDVELGGGISTVTIDNLLAADEFKLDTRGGNDIVNIERNIFAGISVIRKAATISLGDGDDDLAIGGPTPAPNLPGTPDSTRVNFIGGLTANGGNGANDDRNLFEGQNDFGVPPVISLFEAATL